jgi:protoporphyrinogen oxidase
MKIAILGGGLTGLTLGYLLSDSDIDFEILEANNECGGLMRTRIQEGFTFDRSGSHILFSKKPAVLDFMLSLLGDNKQKNRRNTKILYKNCLVKYPFENGLSCLSKEENFECLYSFLKNLLDKSAGTLEKPDNLEDWFYYTFGLGIAQKYLIPYNEKIWKYPPSKLGLDWVERIPDPPVENIIKSSLGIETDGYLHQIDFYYPKKGGIQAIIKALEEKVGASIKIFEVKKIVKRQGWVVSNGKEERVYDKVISTIPLQELVEAINAPLQVKKAAKALKYNSLIAVELGLNKKVSDLSWLYVPDMSVLTHRISFPSNYSYLVVPPNKSALVAEITCNEDDKTWVLPDEEITSRIILELEKLGIINKEDICFSAVDRSRYAYIVNDVNYRHKLKIVKNYLTGLGIDVIGRFAEFEYLNMDNCIEHVLTYFNTFKLKH